MRVLHLYTSTRSFFENQLRALKSVGVETTALRVPGEYEADSPRSATDYLRYVPKVLGHSLDDYDIVHANLGLLGPFAIAQPTRPVVLSLWGSDVMSDRTWLTRLSRASARMADKTVLPSEAMRPALGDAGDQTVVPFGIDVERFRPIDRDRARERIGWDPEERIVLFPYDPARPEKDYSRAERVVQAADTDADLRVLTDAPHEAMPYYLNASDAVLLTSERESGPMIVKEAAACNVPVVATDVGFVKETLGDVAASPVCNSDEELANGLDQVLDGRSRSDARDSLDGLSLERMGERLHEVYERALEKRGGVAGENAGRA